MRHLQKKAQRLVALLACVLFLGVCASAASAKELYGYYEGDDGGAYFVRQIGDKVYWFGEDPDGQWANILMGTITGNKITRSPSLASSPMRRGAPGQGGGDRGNDQGGDPVGPPPAQDVIQRQARPRPGNWWLRRCR